MKELEYIKPKNFYEVFQQISNELHNITFDKMDRELFYDRMKFIEDSVDWIDYTSNDEFEKDNIFHTDVRTIAELIGQLVIFGRIIKTNNFDEKNLPKGEVPLFLRQIDEDGEERDLYNLSSGKAMKKWSEKDKSKQKLRETIT